MSLSNLLTEYCFKDLIRLIFSFLKPLEVLKAMGYSKICQTDIFNEFKICSKLLFTAFREHRDSYIELFIKIMESDYSKNRKLQKELNWFFNLGYNNLLYYESSLSNRIYLVRLLTIPNVSLQFTKATHKLHVIAFAKLFVLSYLHEKTWSFGLPITFQQIAFTNEHLKTFRKKVFEHLFLIQVGFDFYYDRSNHNFKYKNMFDKRFRSLIKVFNSESLISDLNNIKDKNRKDYSHTSYRYLCLILCKIVAYRLKRCIKFLKPVFQSNALGMLDICFDICMPFFKVETFIDWMIQNQFLTSQQVLDGYVENTNRLYFDTSDTFKLGLIRSKNFEISIQENRFLKNLIEKMQIVETKVLLELLNRKDFKSDEWSNEIKNSILIISQGIENFRFKTLNNTKDLAFK